MNHIDLFSGIGGFSLAASWVWGEDHNVVCFCEMDKFCQKVLNKHWPKTPIVEDVRDVERILAHTTGKRSGGQGGNALHQGWPTCESGRTGIQENTTRQNGSAIPNDKPASANGGASELASEGDATNVDLLTGGFP